MDLAPSLVEPVSPTRPALPKRIPATFTGTAKGYSPIFFTNLFLGIITVGVYLSWAKVRNRRYFYGNTSFLGGSFDFDAKPTVLFKSRIFVSFFFGSLLATELIFGLVIGQYGFSTLTFLFLLPMLLVLSRSFNFYRTIWRGVRFSYDKRYGPAYAFLFLYIVPWMACGGLLIFIPNYDNTWNPFRQEGEGLLGFTMLALLLYVVSVGPIATWWKTRILINQLNLGKLKFRYTTAIKSHCAISYSHLFAFVALFIVLFVAIYLLSENLEESPYWLPAVPIFIIYFSVISYFAHITRVLWNGIATTEGSRLEASFNPFEYAFKIVVLNHLLNVISLGFLSPITKIRNWRYLADHITFLPSATLREAIATEGGLGSAIASEAIDLDVGFDGMF